MQLEVGMVEILGMCLAAVGVLSLVDFSEMMLVCSC